MSGDDGFQKRIEKIESDIEEFADLYQVKDQLRIIDATKRVVQFSDPQMNSLAERTLQFRAELLRNKRH